ncbi:MAG: glutathionylspermidine synthase family protein [Rubrivivax sp.]
MATPYEDFARRIVASGVVTNPWIAGAPRFREEPVLVNLERARKMARAAETICEVYNELCLLVADAPELLDSFFGLSAWQKAMWLASQPLWHGIARADVFVTDEGLSIAELNCDTPTGEAEAVILGPIARAAEKYAKCIDPNESLVPRFVEVAETLAKGPLGKPGARRALGLVYPTELPEDLSLVRLYRKAFEDAGWEVILGSPYNLAKTDGGGLSLFDDRVSLVVRHYKTDWWSERQSVWLDEELPDPNPLDEPLDAVLSAMLAGSCAILNPFGAVVPQNKRAMAFMWEQIHRFSRGAQDVIRELVPVTRRLEAFHAEQLAAQKDDWVLKSDYGAEGDEVIVGREVTDEVWRTSLRLARPSRWVAQRYFHAKTDAGGAIVNYGVFVVAGEAAGLYGRVQVGPTDDHALSAPVLLTE